MKTYVSFLTSKSSLCYLLVSLFAGLSGGFFYPLLGIFVVDGLHASSLQMGIFMAISILSGVVVSQRIAKLSDVGWDRRQIILLAQSAFIVVMMLFMVIRDFYLALAVMIFISSFTAAALPQTFAIGREFADKNLGDKSTLFVSLMRAMISLSWVIGPPLAFILYDAFGFNGAFMFAAANMMISLLIVWRWFPSTKLNETESSDGSAMRQPWHKIPGAPLYLCAVFMLFMANNMYVMSIPLYVTKELEMAGAVAGQLLGLAAFVEIPVMVLAGLWAAKMAPQRLMVLSAAAACLFYTLLFHADTLWQMYALQLLNGLAVGISASLGMVVIQNKMPNQMGVATTLFNSAIMVASLASSMTVGVVAELYNYHSVMLAMLLAGAVAFGLLLLSARETRRPPCPADWVADA
ncbi:MFS transporter [Grimontia hollisae]|uniref:Transporter major facilitator superfamily MFS_1 n=1 Tax=Grimontia hollisae CIP 101886 TaxID=675812 RepID=D0ICB3_GRIHO|nr:sugar efflux transporter [Grimontia hollisae]AMG29906.1 MFS transporter [Grimontia hollisae]EEY71531.1 transporter major facilitator superfamily MFS_1 [Grimontia hollisae CIP 101886]STO43084.1 Sugar efflux transporter C [Grimontia hollisae]